MPVHLPPINRRGFLAGALAAGAGLAISNPLFAGETPADPNHFLLLSDTHVSMDPNESRHGIKPAETLAKATDEILALPDRPREAIFCGDCAFLQGRKEDYAALGKLLSPLRKAGTSMHFAMGNHDDRDNFTAVFPEAKSPAVKNLLPGKYVSVLETQHVNWFLLDSLNVTRGVNGELGNLQLKWLAEALDSRPNKPAILAAHHNLNPLFTFKSLVDTKSLLELVASRRHVQAYFFGHTHWWGVGRYSDIYLVNIPTTAWTFEINNSQPRGFVTAKTRSDGATLTLHSLDHKHERHGEKVELKWRT